MPFPTVEGLRTLEIGFPGEMRRRLNQLILDGTKRATAGLLADYEREGEPLEREGEVLVLIDDDGTGIAEVVVTGVTTTSFGDVPWEFAAAEGEGDTSLEQWRDGHRNYWTSVGETVNNTTLVVLTRFELLETPRPNS